MKNWERILSDIANIATIIGLVLVIVEKKHKPRERKSKSKKHKR